MFLLTLLTTYMDGRPLIIILEATLTIWRKREGTSTDCYCHYIFFIQNVI